MRSSRYLLIVLFAYMLSNTSCSKTDTLMPPPIDSLASVLPKQIIGTNTDPGGPPGSEVISIKYDTANLKIEIYQDDTTNANPYDVLAQTFTYNNSGYLVSIDDIFNDEFVEIKRASNNDVIWLRHNSPSDDNLDTTFYQHQQMGGNTIITTTTNTYNAGVFQFSSGETDTYNAGLKLVYISNTFGNNDTLTYNANGSIDKSTMIYGPDTYQDNYVYGSGIADAPYDALLNVLMGKDAYIVGIRYFYPFSSSIGNPVLSFTDPYHLTRFVSTINGVTDVDETYSYQLNAQNLLSKTTVTLAGTQGATTLEFRY